MSRIQKELESLILQYYYKGIESLPQTRDFLITISLEPNVAYLRYLKL